MIPPEIDKPDKEKMQPCQNEDGTNQHRERRNAPKQGSHKSGRINIQMMQTDWRKQIPAQQQYRQQRNDDKDETLDKSCLFANIYAGFMQPETGNDDDDIKQPDGIWTGVF